MEAGIIIVGSADTVRETIEERQRQFQFGNFSGIFHFGTLPDELFQASLTRFAESVLPHVRNRSAGPMFPATPERWAIELPVRSWDMSSPVLSRLSEIPPQTIGQANVSR